MLSEPLSLSPSYYEASVTRLAPEPPLAGEETADVCVIGGGFYRSFLRLKTRFGRS